MLAPGMTGTKAFESQPGSFSCPVFLDGLNAIFRAGWAETASWHEVRRKQVLVYFNKACKKEGEQFADQALKLL
jgi:hypothetical protein